MTNYLAPQFRLPDVESRRALLTQKRDEYLATAFNADTEIEGILVQTPRTVGVEPSVSDQQKADAIANLRSVSENCQRSAAKMQEMLDALPKPSVPVSALQPLPSQIQ